MTQGAFCGVILNNNTRYPYGTIALMEQLLHANFALHEFIISIRMYTIRVALRARARARVNMYVSVHEKTVRFPSPATYKSKTVAKLAHSLYIFFSLYSARERKWRYRSYTWFTRAFYLKLPSFCLS
jgi:uncharacterized membrane protein YoaT (DUF817 family)